RLHPQGGRHGAHLHPQAGHAGKQGHRLQDRAALDPGHRRIDAESRKTGLVAGSLIFTVNSGTEEEKMRNLSKLAMALLIFGTASASAADMASQVLDRHVAAMKKGDL